MSSSFRSVYQDYTPARRHPFDTLLLDAVDIAVPAQPSPIHCQSPSIVPTTYGSWGMLTTGLSERQRSCCHREGALDSVGGLMVSIVVVLLLWNAFCFKQLLLEARPAGWGCAAITVYNHRLRRVLDQ